MKNKSTGTVLERVFCLPLNFSSTKAKNAEQFGIEVSEVKVDFGKIMERMRKLRARISHHDSCKRYASELGVDVYQVCGLYCVLAMEIVLGYKYHDFCCSESLNVLQV